MSPSHRANARALVLLALFGLASIPVCAQTVTGTMKGTVTDRTGAALPGVTVTIRNAQTGLERIAVTTSGARLESLVVSTLEPVPENVLGAGWAIARLIADCVPGLAPTPGTAQTATALARRWPRRTVTRKR
jgi:hypothetical protein